jgi:ferredoxin-NADP reductase
MKNLFTRANVIRKELIKPSLGEKPTLVKITIKMQNLLEKPFRPGQFCTFRIMEDVYRAYSIASSYKNFSEYSFLVSCGHQGLGSNYFRDINIGDEVIFLGPNGHFSLIQPVKENIFIFCTGTGIAPFIPILEFLTDNNCNTNISLIQGLRDETNLEYYQTIHQDFKNKCPNIISKIYLSQPKGDLTSEFSKGRIISELSHITQENLKNSQFYLCGHPEMVLEMFQKLKGIGVSDSQIMAEEFTSPGYFESQNH